MFKSNNIFSILFFSTLMLTTLFVSSCGDDDDDNGCTASFVNQTATGEFMGSAFTFVEGTASEDPFDDTQYRIVLYGETVTGDACDNFNFDKPDLSIIFSVPQMVGTYDLSLTANGYAVTFNDASVVNTANADVAICGAIEITNISGNTLTGKIDADANADSFLNGNFSIAICQ